MELNLVITVNVLLKLNVTVRYFVLSNKNDKMKARNRDLKFQVSSIKK